MSYADSSYGAAPYASDSTSTATPPGQTLPPPIPGSSNVYYYSDENGFYPYCYGGWAGARPRIVSAPGGVVITPRQDIGVMELTGWWPNADHLHFIRLHDDGSRHPVRGGYGVETSGDTVSNHVSNPSVETGLNGFVPDVGSPTLTRISTTSDIIPDGGFALRATISGSGSLGVTVPTVAVAGPATATLGATLRFSARPTSLTFAVSWTDSGGGSLGSTSVTFTANEINQVVAQWNRLVGTVTPPFGAVTPTFKITAGGLPAGATMDGDKFLLVGAGTDGSYFDGDTLGARWRGTADLSATDLSALTTVMDADCPLDAPVRYLVADPQITGGYVLSSTVELPSNGRWCWLTHPRYGLPIRCDLQSVPVLTHAIDQGVFYAIGRRNAIVVSSRRHAPTAELVFNAVSFDERDTLIDVMADGSPMLLRAPSRYGYGAGTWWSVGGITEDREGRLAYHDAMILTAEAVEVDPPSPYLSASQQAA